MKQRPKLFGLLQKKLLISVLNHVFCCPCCYSDKISLIVYLLYLVLGTIIYIVTIFSQEHCRLCHFCSSAGDNETWDLGNFGKVTQPVSDRTWVCTQVILASQLMLWSLPCTACVEIEASVNHLCRILSPSVALDQNLAHSHASRIQLLPPLIIGTIFDCLPSLHTFPIFLHCLKTATRCGPRRQLLSALQGLRPQFI